MRGSYSMVTPRQSWQRRRQGQALRAACGRPRQRLGDDSGVDKASTPRGNAPSFKEETPQKRVEITTALCAATWTNLRTHAVPNARSDRPGVLERGRQTALWGQYPRDGRARGDCTRRSGLEDAPVALGWDNSPVVGMWVISISGIQGTGKTTLAGALAKRMDAVLVSRDPLMAVLLEGGLTAAGLKRPRVVPVAELGHELQSAVLRQQLDVGRSVVLECVAAPSLRDGWPRQSPAS